MLKFLTLFLFISPLLDDERLVVWGLDKQVFERGCVGNGEISPLVRISAVNGILNHRTDCHRVVQKISAAHGENNVHYIFWNSEGWTEDIFKGLFAKIGVISQPALELSKLWKELINQMGGIESGGQILHYAHSLGATETVAASALLNPEEQQMIHVVALGPATIVHPEGFGSVKNYFSKRDAIALLDPIHFFWSLYGEYSHVHFVGEYQLSAEHTLSEGGTYLQVIDDYGRAFIENYLYLD